MECTKVLEQNGLLQMAEQDLDLLHPVYRELCEKLGMKTAVELYQMFKGQQISFPVRMMDPQKLRQAIVQAYNGANIRELAGRYGYSEKSIRRLIKSQNSNENKDR